MRPRVRRAGVAAALVAGALLALSAPLPATPRTRSTSTTSSPTDGAVSLVLAVDGIPDGRDRRPRTRSRSRSTAAPSSRRPRSIAAGDIERIDRAGARREQQHAAGRQVRRGQGRRRRLPRRPRPTDVAHRPGDVRRRRRRGHRAHHRPRGRAQPPSTASSSRKGTSVYDGIAEGLDLLGAEGSRSLLVLSDGGDTSSATTLDVVTNDAADAGVVVDVVSLAQAARTPTTMADLADEHGRPGHPGRAGRARARSSPQQADALAQQLLVTFERPEDAADEVNLGVTVDAGGTTFTDSAFVSLGAAASASRTS